MDGLEGLGIGPFPNSNSAIKPNIDGPRSKRPWLRLDPEDKLVVFQGDSVTIKCKIEGADKTMSYDGLRVRWLII